MVRGEVLNLQEIQGCASTTTQKNGSSRYSLLEMGRDHDGLHHEATTDNARGGFDLDHCGLIDQERTFYSHSGKQLNGDLTDIYIRDVVARHGVPI